MRAPVPGLWMSLLLGTLLLASPGVRSASPEPQKFKDWGSRCERIPDTEKDLCHVFQTVQIKETGVTVLSFAAFYTPGSDLPTAVFTVPLGVFLPAGIGLQIDEGEKLRFHYEICTDLGCRAFILMKQPMVDAMKAGKTATVTITDGQRRSASIPVSLNGFTAALGSLK